MAFGPLISLNSTLAVYSSIFMFGKFLLTFLMGFSYGSFLVDFS
jgi:hypothetical protein